MNYQENRVGRIGVPPGEPRPQLYELDVAEHVPVVDPARHGLTGKPVNPRDYFITSGDAVPKAAYLLRVLTTLLDSTPRESTLYPEVEHAIARTVRLVTLLVEARGDAVFLETEWGNHTLYVIPKNPRKRDDE